MFSDTHFHFKMMTEERGINGVEVLTTMAGRDCFFGLDIGTRAGDLEGRKQAVEKSINAITDTGLVQKARKFMHYSAGIWPDIDSIKDRENQMIITGIRVGPTVDPKVILMNRFTAVNGNFLKHRLSLPVSWIFR